MTQDTITYKGKEYPVREVKGYLFGTEGLEAILFDEYFQPIDTEAERVDELICYYFNETEYETFSDDEIIKLYLPHTQTEDGVLGYVDGYNIFLMINLAKQFGLIEFELEYDLQWSEGLKLYDEFFNSIFNDVEYSEYDTIVNFLKHKQDETKDQG